MKVKYLVLGLFLIIGIAKAGSKEPVEWFKTGTMQDVTTVFDLACDEESNVYAAIEVSRGDFGASMGVADTGKVLKSTDKGMHWELTGDIPNFNAKAVLCLLITRDGTIYCGTSDRGDIGRVYKSENGGETWEATGPIPNVEQSVYCLLEGKDGTIYAGGGFTAGSKVWKSTNGGASWTLTGRLGGRSVRSLLELPNGTIYAGTVLGTGMVDTTTWVYKSTNKGQSWERAGEFPEAKVVVVFSMDYDEKNDILYAGTGVVDTNYTPPVCVPKVFKSFDKGNSWIELNPISKDAGEAVKSIIKSDSGVLYIGTLWGITGDALRRGRAWIFKSTDDYHINESGRFGDVSTSNGVSAIVQAPDGILYASITGPPAGAYKNTKEKIIGIEEKDSPHTKFTALPNPFTKNMEISYHLSAPTKVGLKIYDASGKFIKTLIDKTQSPGFYKTFWNGRNSKGNQVPNGVYFFEFETKKEREVRKVIKLF